VSFGDFRNIQSHFIWSVQGQEKITFSVNFPVTAIMAVSIRFNVFRFS